MLHWQAMVSATMRPTIRTATMMVGTAVPRMQTQIPVLIVVVISQRLVQLDIIPWLEMDFAMMTLIMLNVIMMEETAVDTTSPQSIALNAHASTKRLAYLE